ncbi:MAG: hypothetical protein Q8K43_02405, partial [Sulfurimicrobium sp.]|nr:hypothetical protein [Sulfurimicrobium sp.]
MTGILPGEKFFYCKPGCIWLWRTNLGYHVSCLWLPYSRCAPGPESRFATFDILGKYWMNGDTQDDMQQLPSSGSEKRAFSRNAIFLVGECVIPQQPARAIEILDFCPGGIFLSFPRGQQTPAAPVPVRGQIIEIRCSVPTANSIQSLRFQGRVARADRAGAGIAFINPSFEALRILHEFANSAPPEQAFVAEIKPEDANIPGKIDFNAEPLIRECCQMVEECIESMAKSFLEKAAEHCFTLAGEVRGIAEKNTYYAAL